MSWPIPRSLPVTGSLFSSRRRHTRCLSDWSSDVCSSDLAKSIFELEHRVLRVDGTLGWTYSRAIPLQDANGEIVEWLGAASDITVRKQAEEALRQSERMYRGIGESIDYGVWVCDPD